MRVDLYQSCLLKQIALKESFSAFISSKELLYQAIIDLGKKQSALDERDKIASNIVPGCQSIMYLSANYIDGKLYFKSESDALISAGLAQLLVSIYDNETPESILGCPPNVLHELGILSSLTPGRANGLASLYQMMKKHALYAITKKETN